MDICTMMLMRAKHGETRQLNLPTPAWVQDALMLVVCHNTAELSRACEHAPADSLTVAPAGSTRRCTHGEDAKTP